MTNGAQKWVYGGSITISASVVFALGLRALLVSTTNAALIAENAQRVNQSLEPRLQVVELTQAKFMGEMMAEVRALRKDVDDQKTDLKTIIKELRMP